MFNPVLKLLLLSACKNVLYQRVPQVFSCNYFYLVLQHSVLNLMLYDSDYSPSLDEVTCLCPNHLVTLALYGNNKCCL